MSDSAAPPPDEPPAETAMGFDDGDATFDTHQPAQPGRDGPVAARTFERIPPHSLDAEVSVLGAALLSRTASIEVSEVLEPTDFYRTAHRDGVRGRHPRHGPR